MNKYLLAATVVASILLSSCSIFQPSAYFATADQDSSKVTDANLVINVKLEEARQNYVNALNLKQLGKTEAAIDAFEAALETITQLSYYPEIEGNEAFNELEVSIKDDYIQFIDELDELPENVSLFAFEEWMNKEMPDNDSTDVESNENLDTREEIVVGEFKLEVNKYVEKYLEFFTGRGRKNMEVWLKRSGKYFPMMARVFAEENVPQQLLFLAMPESGLNPTASSWARAVGMWQFIKGTARYYDLKINFYVDERRDPEKATRAAAQHLRDLYKQYGTWYTALATYNCSPARVRRSIRQAGSNDFWQYRRFLPRETRNYIPQYIAVTIIASQPEKYGFENLQYEKPIDYKIHEIEKGTDLNVLAKCAGVSLKLLKEMNPELLQHCTPPDYDGGYPLKVPAISYEAFVSNLESVPDEARLQYVVHTVKSGETLSGISYKYKVKLAHLAKFNNISVKSKIYPKVQLKIPVSNFSETSFTINTDQMPAVEEELYSTYSEAPYKLVIGDIQDDEEYLKLYQGGVLSDSNVVIPDGKEKIEYVVKKFDNLVDIAQLFDLRVSDIRNWNGLPYTTTVKVGQTLSLYVNKDKIEYYSSIDDLSRKDKLQILYANSAGEWITHRIRRGEVLGKIAMKYGVSVSKLKKWNNLKNNRIVAGKKLQIFTGDAKYAAVASEDSFSSSNTTTNYKVRRGDSLSKIAWKFKISQADIKKWNNLKSDKLFAGQTLIVHGEDKVSSLGDNSVKSDAKLISYTIKNGDTLSEIAENFKVSVNALKSWNNISNSKNIKAGKSLKIYSDVDYAKAVSSESSDSGKIQETIVDITNNKSEKVTYIVKKNDTLGQIAEKFAVRSNQLREWNKISGSKIKVGQELIVFPDYTELEKRKTSVAAGNNFKTENNERLHKVTRGDSLSKIAQKYKVKVEDIKKWNNLSNNKIRRGQTIKIYL